MAERPRIRKQFKTHSEVLTAKSRLEVDAATEDGAIRAVNTRLIPGQLAEAEAAFSRLGERSLSEAIEWFWANYRAPHKEMALGSPDAEGTVGRKGGERMIYRDAETGRTIWRMTVSKTNDKHCYYSEQEASVVPDVPAGGAALAYGLIAKFTSPACTGGDTQSAPLL
jgi:hypothetical protein